MITAHPSPQLQATATYFGAWIALVVLLVLLGTYSGKTAVGLALGLFLTALIVVYVKNTPSPNSGGVGG